MTPRRLASVALFVALGACRGVPEPRAAPQVSTFQDLVVDQGSHARKFDPSTVPHTCADETHFAMRLRAGEWRRFFAELDGPATLVVAACGEDQSAAATLRFTLTAPDGGQRELVHRLGAGWPQAEFELQPVAGRLRLRVDAEGPEGSAVLLRDLFLRRTRPVDAPRPAKRAILISLDALREDAIGALGGGARTTRLDQFAAAAERFSPHWAAEISTKPSHATMLTGLPVAVHGCDRGEVPLAENVSTVAERVAATGAGTAAFLSVAPFFHPRYRLDQGFATYRLLPWSTVQELRAAANWVAGRRDDSFFLFVHLYEAHSDPVRLPYEAPGVTRATLAELFGVVDYGCRGAACGSRMLAALNRGGNRVEREAEILRYLYDRGVESLDRELGSFFDQLRRSGLWDDTLIIVTADHGEQFGEHGWFLHTSVHEETLRVPLLVKWPGGRHGGSSSDQPSTSVDLAPTLLAHFGLPVDDLVGRDLARPPSGRAAMVSFAAARVGDRKLLLEDPPHRAALFDLAADPAERRDLLPNAASEAELLRGVWERFHEKARRLAGRPSPTPPRPFSPEELERLRSLGYLQ